MAQLDSRNTSRSEDWQALWAEVKQFPRGHVGHKAWNIVVEELRRHGIELKTPDHQYKAVVWAKEFVSRVLNRG
jgi:hypothetical protein